MDEQIEEFISLWHQLLKLEQSTEVSQKYPNFSKLTLNEISVINIVSKNPKVILKDISTMLNLPKSTLTNVINTLDKKGYLYRTIAKQDLRSYGLELTERGILAQEEHLRYEIEGIGQLVSLLDTEERTQLIHIMRKILNHV